MSTKSSTTAKSTARPSCIVGSGENVLMANRPLFYTIGHERYRIRRNNAKLWPLRRSRSFKITDFGTNQKPIYDFLLMIITNLPPILHMGFLLVPKSVALNDLKRRNGHVVCIISPNSVAFAAYCVKVLEDRPIHSASEM